MEIVRVNFFFIQFSLVYGAVAFNYVQPWQSLFCILLVEKLWYGEYHFQLCWWCFLCVEWARRYVVSCMNRLLNLPGNFDLLCWLDIHTLIKRKCSSYFSRGTRMYLVDIPTYSLDPRWCTSFNLSKSTWYFLLNGKVTTFKN